MSKIHRASAIALAAILGATTLLGTAPTVTHAAQGNLDSYVFADPRGPAGRGRPAILCPIL